MKNTKKILSIMLILVMLAFTACSSKDDADTDSQTSDTTDTTDTTQDTTETPDADVATDGTETQLDYAKGLSDNGFYEGVTALDYVTLMDYKAISIPSENHTISEEAIQSEIDGLLSYFTTTEEVTDQAVVDGDTVNIDYVGSVDGVPFDGGSTGGAGTEVTIGVTSYIDDFLQQLIGHTPGESFDIEVTFPADYGVDTLNGKDAIFAITINYVSKSVVPELTDAFITENLATVYTATTVDELKVQIAAELQKGAIRAYLQEYLLDSASVASVPESVYDFQENSMVNYYENAAISYGMSVTDFLTNYVGYDTIEALIADSEAQLTDACNFSLTIQAIAEDAGLTVTEDMLADFFLKINGSADYSEIEAHYGIAYLNYSVLQETVLDYLVENAQLG